MAFIKTDTVFQLNSIKGKVNAQYVFPEIFASIRMTKPINPKVLKQKIFPVGVTCYPL